MAATACADAVYADLQQFDLATGEWKELFNGYQNPAIPTPPNRTNQGFAAAGNSLFVFGGMDPTGQFFIS